MGAAVTTLFGTDGVRGIANQDLTPELGVSLARAAARALLATGGRVIIGRDSRTSGPMLEAALAAGFASAGIDVGLAGIIPTPAISFLIKDEGAELGAVLSASHNPPEDNGVKFFARSGLKLSVEEEQRVESAFASPAVPARRVGSIEPLDAAATRYAAFLTGTIESEDVDLSGLTLVVDCAFGATGPIAPRVFRHLGARVIELNAETDGSRINVDCGSTHLATVRDAVLRHKADLGIAFDGDGDRVLLVSSQGHTIDGDHVIGIAALHRGSKGPLRPPLVVGTILSNLGLEQLLRSNGITMIRTPVGDRHVAQAMVAHGARIGGEPSGHVIFADHAPTGDGILTAVQLLEIAHDAGESVEALACGVTLFPHSQQNVPCPSMAAARTVALDEVAAFAEARLAGRGRAVLRPSGTQPAVRVFVEAEDEALADAVCREAAEKVAALVIR
jgi:phosphoglucosamine mutase